MSPGAIIPRTAKEYGKKYFSHAVRIGGRKSGRVPVRRVRSTVWHLGRVSEPVDRSPQGKKKLPLLKSEARTRGAVPAASNTTVVSGK